MPAPAAPYRDGYAYLTHRPDLHAHAHPPPTASMTMPLDRERDDLHYAPHHPYHDSFQHHYHRHHPEPRTSIGTLDPRNIIRHAHPYHGDSDDHHDYDSDNDPHIGDRKGRNGSNGHSDADDRLQFAHAHAHAHAHARTGHGDGEGEGNGEGEFEPSRKRKRDTYKRTANLRPAEDYRQPPLEIVPDFQRTGTYKACHKWLNERKGSQTKAARKELAIRERMTESLDDETTLWASVVDSDVENGACDGCRKAGIACMVPMGTADEERRVVQSVCIMCKVKRRSCDLCHSVSARRKPNLPPTPNTAPTSSLPPGIVPSQGPLFAHAPIPLPPRRHPTHARLDSTHYPRAYAAPASHRSRDYAHAYTSQYHPPSSQLKHTAPARITLSRILLQKHRHNPPLTLSVSATGKMSADAVSAVRAAVEGVISALDYISTRIRQDSGRRESGQGHVGYLIKGACAMLGEGLGSSYENGEIHEVASGNDNHDLQRGMKKYNETQRILADITSMLVDDEQDRKGVISGLGYVLVKVQREMDRWREALLSAPAVASRNG